LRDTALGLTTQSKLTVQAPAVCAILGAMAAVPILGRCPVFGVGGLNGSLLVCLRKDVALCNTASWLGPGGAEGWDDGTFHVHRLYAREKCLCLRSISCEAKGTFCLPEGLVYTWKIILLK